jgi:hypothetical protein
MKSIQGVSELVEAVGALLPHGEASSPLMGRATVDEAMPPAATGVAASLQCDTYELARQLTRAKTAGRNYRDDVLGDAFLAVVEGATTRDEIENAIRCSVIKEWTYSRRNGPICDVQEPMGPPERAKFDVWGEVYRLPLRQRSAVVLVFCEGFTEAEAGKELGCTDVAVHQLIDRAIARLRKIFSHPVRKRAFRFP